MPAFIEHFNGKLKEVFLYITDRCNLKCPYCYMPESRNLDMPLSAYASMIETLVGLGASKITFLGGEPTLHSLLFQFIKTAKNAGFDYLRLDTNGQFAPRFFKNTNFKLLNDICFSLDGADARTHGMTRTAQNYYAVINNIKRAVSLGYVVRVTTTVNSCNVSQLEKMISMLEELGVAILNFHLVSNSGRARDNQRLLVIEEEWMNFYKRILSKIDKYNIKIKIPKRYAEENEAGLKDIITCEAAKTSRMAITPDLKVYACPLLLDRKRYFACFRKDKFVYTRNYQRNLIWKDKIQGPICPLLMQENCKKYQKKKIIPLCVSYKPDIKSKVEKV